MNPKERVTCAINKEQPDITPLGLYVVDHDTISKVLGRQTYLRNRCAMQIALWEGRRDEMVESMKEDVIEFYTKIDCVDLLTLKEAIKVPPAGYKPENPPKRIDAHTYEEQNGDIWKLAPESNSIKIISKATEATELKTYAVDEFSDREIPEPDDPSCYELSDHFIEHFKAEKYIAGYSARLVAITMLDGMQNGMMTLAMQPEVIKAANAQAVFKNNHKDAYEIRPGIDGVMFEYDMAGTNGPLISPTMFRELCYPYYKQRISQVKGKADQIILHNCGNNLPIMDMLVAGGIDCYESIQTNSEMNIRTMIDGWGDRLAIWGAVALEYLNTGTPENVRTCVRQCYREADGFPGFILGPSHSIAFGTKYDNFMAMLDEHIALR